MTPTMPTKTARSRPFSIRPRGNASSRYATHGNVSQVARRPIVCGTLSLDSASAVSDHAKPIASSAMPNDLLTGARSA
jgi:hypothetical protein